MEKLEIEVQLDPEKVVSALHLKGSSALSQAQALIATARPLIHARAAYKVCYIDAKLDHAVVVDGVTFTSQVLRKNLDPVERVFLCVITIGRELEARSSQPDLLEQYYFDIIGNLALAAARQPFEKHLQDKFGVGNLSRMNPGSLADWPIEQQQPFFALLGDVESAIGVRLTETMLMSPKKSGSSLYFPSEVTFRSCQLCPRPVCPGRQAPYDEALARQYGTIS